LHVYNESPGGGILVNGSGRSGTSQQGKCNAKSHRACDIAYFRLSPILLYDFDHKFTNSENLLAKMADKFSFEF
jgi:hypothetical protein